MCSFLRIVSDNFFYFFKSFLTSQHWLILEVKVIDPTMVSQFFILRRLVAATIKVILCFLHLLVLCCKILEKFTDELNLLKSLLLRNLKFSQIAVKSRCCDQFQKGFVVFATPICSRQFYTTSATLRFRLLQLGCSLIKLLTLVSQQVPTDELMHVHFFVELKGGIIVHLVAILIGVKNFQSTLDDLLGCHADPLHISL